MGLNEALEQFGLNKKEAQLYLTGLTLGTTSITRLANQSGLKRPTVYLILSELLKKQLFISVPKGNKIYYKVEDPEKLLQNMEQRKRQLELAAPEFKKLYSKSLTQPKVRFYEGKDKLFKVYEEIFKAKEIWAMFSPKRFLEVFSEKENEHFFKILIRHGGMLYDLLENTKEAKKLASYKYRSGVSKTKYLSKDFDFSTDTIVFDKKIALISFANTACVVIEDEQIADSQRQMIKYIWSH
jgi:sugar-specific transcriptional regulator TrmB